MSDAETVLVAVSAGESATSKTRAIASAGIEIHGSGELIDLHGLDAEALLGRKEDALVSAAVEAAGTADVLLIATPVYRATYTGALKAFFDRFQTNGLSSTACVLVATAAAPEHFLAVDTGLRTLVASLGGWSVPTVTYATGDDFADGEPNDEVWLTLRRAIGEAVSLAKAIRTG